MRTQFDWYGSKPEGFDHQMQYLMNLKKQDGPMDGYPPMDPPIVGEIIGRWLAQHLLLAVKADAQAEGGMTMLANEENYWKSIYQDWKPEHHMAIVACGLMQIYTLRPASTAATIERLLKDLDRHMNTRDSYVEVPEWSRILVLLKR